MENDVFHQVVMAFGFSGPPAGLPGLALFTGGGLSDLVAEMRERTGRNIHCLFLAGDDIPKTVRDFVYGEDGRVRPFPVDELPAASGLAKQARIMSRGGDDIVRMKVLGVPDLCAFPQNALDRLGLAADTEAAFALHGYVPRRNRNDPLAPCDFEPGSGGDGPVFHPGNQSKPAEQGMFLVDIPAGEGITVSVSATASQVPDVVGNKELQEAPDIEREWALSVRRSLYDMWEPTGTFTGTARELFLFAKGYPGIQGDMTDSMRMTVRDGRAVALCGGLMGAG